MFQKLIKIFFTLLILLIMMVQVTVGRDLQTNWTAITKCNSKLAWLLFISVVAGFFFFLVQLIASFCSSQNKSYEDEYEEDSLGRKVVVFYTIILLIFKLFWNSFTLVEYYQYK